MRELDPAARGLRERDSRNLGPCLQHLPVVVQQSLFEWFEIPTSFLQSTCCTENIDGTDLGACNAHVLVCSSAECGGVFLQLRRCQLMLLCERQRGKHTFELIG